VTDEPHDSRAWFEQVTDPGRAGERIAERYTLGEVLGRGGYGAVWRARDEVRGDAVALKFLKPRGAERARQSLHEIATLRRLDVDGVARLRDYADEGGRVEWLAMDLAPGRPFGDGCATWADVADATRRLLAILTEVHARGIVHRDLKPSNVFVDDDGRVTVLDFGGAWNPELAGARRRRVVGTPRYLAPEQLRGQPGDARTDLYAVGTMLYHVLSGRWPHDATPQDLFAVKLRQPPRPLADAAPDVPAAVAAVIDAMLAIRPQGRPSTAADALVRLDDPDARDAFVAIVGDGDDPVDDDTMMQWFAGPERILHLQSDAVRELRARGATTRDRALAILQRWRRTRRCWARDGRIVLPRTSLNRLSDDRELATTGPIVQLARDPRERIDALFAAIDRLLAQNDGQRAMPLLELLVREPLTDAERTKCIAWMCVAALETTTSANVRMARYILERHDAADRLPDVAGALDAATMARSGSVADAVRRWQNLRRTGIPHVDEKTAMLSMPVLQALDAGARTQLIRDVVQPFTRSTPILSRAHHQIAAWAAYQNYRFDAAAAALEAAATAGDRGAVPLLTNAASAWLEAGQHDRARALVATCRGERRVRRDPNLGFRLLWLDRSARYRSGENLVPRLDLVRDCANVATPQTTALLIVNEAACAYRSGEPDVVAECLDIYLSRFGTSPAFAAPHALLHAILIALGAPPAHPAAMPMSAPPRVRAQAEALAREHPDAIDPRWFPAHGRGEVLSLDECTTPR